MSGNSVAADHSGSGFYLGDNVGSWLGQNADGGRSLQYGSIVSAFVRSFFVATLILLVVLVAGAVFMPDGFGFVTEEEREWLFEDNQTVSDGAEDAPPFAELNENPELDEDAVAEHVINKVNRERTERDRNELGTDEELARVAANHSEDMIERDFFAHQNPDGDGPGDRVFRAVSGCLSTGENIAMTWYETAFQENGQIKEHSSAEDVAEGLVQQWLDSPEHRDNMLFSEWEETGVGIRITEDGEIIATQKFCD